MFRSDAESAEDFVAQARERGVVANLVRTSAYSKVDLAAVEDLNLLVLIQDLPPGQLLDHVEDLVNHLVYPAWYGHRSICLFSLQAKDAYEVGAIAGSRLHDDLSGVGCVRTDRT